MVHWLWYFTQSHQPSCRLWPIHIRTLQTHAISMQSLLMQSSNNHPQYPSKTELQEPRLWKSCNFKTLASPSEKDTWLCNYLINLVPLGEFYFQGSNTCITAYIYPTASSQRRDSSTLLGYLEWWNWRVQVYLARLVTWRLGPVVHRRKSARRPPGESGGPWGCTPAGGYIAQLLRGECGAGRPAGTARKQARRNTLSG